MQRWRRVVAAAVVTAAVLATAAAAVQTARLYPPSPLDRDGAAIVADALPRLAYLRGALAGGAGDRMQQLFPEGYFFSYVLYGLTWVDVGMRAEPHRAEAIEQARWALAHLDSPAGRAPFAAGLTPSYGVFYVGWSSWLRGGVVRLAGGPAAAPADADHLYADTDALAAAFAAQLTGTGSPYLAAYPGQAWPVDSVVGMAALRLADQLRGTRHAGLRDRWWRAVDARLDPATELLPHRVDPVTGTPVEGARGSSQALALRFLRELDPDRAARDWRRFRDRFASTVPGFPAVREHPRGVRRSGDVDSGPLLFGLSGSASAVALGTAVLVGDRATARALAGLVEVTGLAVRYRGTRRYLAGALPIADAFLAWSLAADGWVVPAGTGSPVGGGPSPWWRLLWHLGTLLLLGLCWLLARSAVRLAPAEARSVPR